MSDSKGAAWLRNLKPGDTVWFVPDDRRDSIYMGELRIAGVGRKYLTTLNRYRPVELGDRFLLENGRGAPGQYPRGRIHPDREAYERERMRQVAWDGLRRELSLRRSPPDGVTAEDIANARPLLGLPE